MLSIAINYNLMKLICFSLRITEGIGSVLKKILMAQTNFNCYNLPCVRNFLAFLKTWFKGKFFTLW